MSIPEILDSLGEIASSLVGTDPESAALTISAYNRIVELQN